MEPREAVSRPCFFPYPRGIIPIVPYFASFSMLCTRQNSFHCPSTFFRPRRVKRFSPVAQVGEHRFHRRESAAIEFPSAFGIDGLPHPVHEADRRRIGLAAKEHHLAVLSLETMEIGCRWEPVQTCRIGARNVERQRGAVRGTSRVVTLGTRRRKMLP